MSDNANDRREDPAATTPQHDQTTDHTIDATPATPAAREDVSAAPADTSAASASAPAAPGNPPAPPAAAAPSAQTPPQATQAAPPAWNGTAPAYPRHPYGQPQPQAGYGAHPTAPTRPLYAGAPAAAPGQAFGPAGTATGTHPTLPPSSDDARRRKAGAGRVVGLIVAAALVGGAAGLGGAWAGVNMWGDNESAPLSAPSTITVNDTDDVNATTAIAAKVVPSVVTISASAGSSGGTGSGVILTADGYVVTNTHVVTLDGQTADPTIQVTTSDGRVYQAEVIGTDPTYDLAVIKLKDASGLTPIEFGDSSDLNVGDETVAVGAPLGLSNTVTTGIVSALNRSIQVQSSAAPEEQQPDGSEDNGGGESPFRFDFGQGQQSGGSTETIKIAVIQTDAAINPGNSGGALVDSEGKLIGINVAIASAGGSSSGGQAGSIGVGFAIPSSIAKRVADEIIADGAATHGLLGATVQPVSVVNADISGAYIQDVTPDGAAAKAGLEKGDIVTEFNGIPITSWIDLTAQVRALAGGSSTTVTYVRDGQTKTADVTLGTFQP